MYFHVGEIVVVKDDVLLVDYFLGNELFVDAHVLEVLHGIYQIEVFLCQCTFILRCVLRMGWRC